jgi:ADP-ribose pyrophosphatase
MTFGDAASDPSRREAQPGRIRGHRVHTGKIITLDTDTVRFPDGSVGEMDMIRHPGASAIVPFVSDATSHDPQLMLIRQYRYAADQYLYEIPAGRLDPGEDPRDCAKRELREETGCTAQGIDFLFTMYTTPGFTDERIHLFIATGLERGETAHEPDEFMTIETVVLSQALRMIREGEIKDAKTALGILFAAEFRVAR